MPLKEWDIRINYGIKTGFNDAFIISGEKKDELIAADPKSAQIIRPILRGRDIKRYGYNFADLWLIHTHNGIKEKHIPPVDINLYPVIKAHLDKSYPALEKRQDKGITPYNLRNCAYTDDLNRQKILWSEISDIPKFALDEEGEFYITNKVFLMTGNVNLWYLYAFFNSLICEIYFSFIASTTGEGTSQWFKYKVESIPVPKCNLCDETDIINLAKLVLSSKNNFDRDMAVNKIDKLFFKAFNFSNDEINHFNASSR